MDLNSIDQDLSVILLLTFIFLRVAEGRRPSRKLKFGDNTHLIHPKSLFTFFLPIFLLVNKTSNNQTFIHNWRDNLVLMFCMYIMIRYLLSSYSNTTHIISSSIPNTHPCSRNKRLNYHKSLKLNTDCSYP